MKVLVTGANGFVGQAIVSELFRNSYEILAVGRVGSENQNPNLVKIENYFRADIADKDKLLNIKPPGQIEAVIHCAGLAHQFGKVEKEDFWRVNVTGTENTAKLADNLGVKHFILISSVAVYGGNILADKIVKENSECCPRDFYAQSKLEGERIAANILAKKRIKLTILRPATVIGEGDRGNFLRLIRAIDKKRFIWIGKGENRKSLIHKNDVARACVYALKKAQNEFDIYNVGAKPITMKEIVDRIAFELDTKIFSGSIPVGILKKIFGLNSKLVKNNTVKKFEDTVDKWMAEDIYSTKKISEMLDFNSNISVEDAISREVEWYLSDKFSKK